MLNAQVMFAIEKSLSLCWCHQLPRHSYLTGLLGFLVAHPPFIYLGEPIFKSKPKPYHFQSLDGKVKIKMATWKAKLLFMEGMIQLVKPVVHDMLVHCLTICDWSLKLVKNTKAYIRNFIWSYDVDKRKMITNYCLEVLLYTFEKRWNWHQIVTKHD